METGADGYKRVTVRGLEALVVEALRELKEEQDAKLGALQKKEDAQMDSLKQRLQRREELLSKLNLER